MNTRNRTTATAGQMNALGNAQANAEKASRGLLTAQAAFEKARQNLDNSQEAYQVALTTLAKEFQTVKASTRVLGLGLK